MKKIFLFTAMAFACMMQAKTVTLDVAHPLSPETLEFDAKGVWTETYNEDDYETIDYQSMSFAHAAWADYNFWYGFTIAKCQDTTYATMDDQFRCVAGGGLAGKGTPYVQAYAMEGMGPVSPCQTYFDGAYTAEEIYLCIGSWALHNVTVGGAGHTFAAGDSLVIEIEGLDDEYKVIEGKKVTFFLADYRSNNEADWKLNKGWEKCDLTALGEVYGLVFTMKSSDVGGYGTNTALYFALDGLKISRPTEVATFENEADGINVAKADTCWQGADEPVVGNNVWKSGEFSFTTIKADWGGYQQFTVTNETANTSTGMAEPYRSAKGGAYEGQNFVVWNYPYADVNDITFDAQVVDGFFVNNTAYAVTSMCNGDNFAKKFGKDDWFKLTISGSLNGVAVNNQVVVDLAADGKYINEWTYVDLSTLGEIDAVQFSMSSSDTGDWGMNTPAYFAMDNFGAAKPENYEEPARAEFDLTDAVENTVIKVKAQKVVRDGQLLIIRDGKIFNAQGVVVR